MLVRVTTDNNIAGGDKLSGFVENVVADSFERFQERITRVEVYLADENSSSKSGDHDKRCTMEARLSGLKPIAVSELGSSIDQVIRGAADKMEKALDRTLGRLGDRKGRTPTGGE